MAKEPLHSIVASRAETRIRSGEWAPGTRLPPERELCRVLDISRATLRQALAELEQRGLITRHQGRGTFVTRPRLATELYGFISVAAALRARGLHLTTRVLSVSTVDASRQLAQDLGCLPGDQLLVLERLRSVDEEPLMLESTWLPLARFPELGRADFAGRSLYDILREDYGCEVASSLESFEPVITTPKEAHLLGVPRRAPAVLLRRITTDREGLHVEMSNSLLRGDRSRFLLERRVDDVWLADRTPTDRRPRTSGARPERPTAEGTDRRGIDSALVREALLPERD